jgi:hypothetical protein
MVPLLAPAPMVWYRYRTPVPLNDGGVRFVRNPDLLKTGQSGDDIGTNSE